MLTTIRTYLNLRRNGMARAWEISGMADIGDKAVGAVCMAIAVISVLYLLSDHANAAGAQAEARHAGEIEALKQIVAACLSDSTGRPLRIGDDWFLCGITHIGSFE